MVKLRPESLISCHEKCHNTSLYPCRPKNRPNNLFMVEAKRWNQKRKSDEFFLAPQYCTAIIFVDFLIAIITLFKVFILFCFFWGGGHFTIKLFLYFKFYYLFLLYYYLSSPLFFRSLVRIEREIVHVRCRAEILSLEILLSDMRCSLL